MSGPGKILVYFAVLVVASMGMFACDSSGGMNGGNGDDNRAPDASATVNISEPVVGDTVRVNASESSDPDGDDLHYNWTLNRPDSSDAVLSSSQAVDPYFVVDVNGDYGATVEVSDGNLSDTDDVSVTALKKLPETVTVPFENIATDGDSLVAHTITWEDSVVIENPTPSGTAEIPASRESGQLCAQENDLFDQGCITLTPTDDIAETQPIHVDRKTVELTVAFDLPYGDPAETDVTVYGPFRRDSTSFSGDNTLNLAKRKQGLTREIVADNVTEDPEREDRLDRLYAETSVSANSNVEKTLTLEKLQACNDEIDNETGPGDDDLVDVWQDTNGNGIPDKGDVGDPGCSDPDDDNEGHMFFTRVTTQYNQDLWISSAENEREEMVDNHESTNPLPATAQHSIGDFVVTIENIRKANEVGERFYLRFNTGPKDQLGNINSTQTVADSDTIDGWHDAAVYGVDASFWGDENYYTITAVYDGPTDNGDIDIGFLNADGDGRKTVLSYLYEEEHHNGGSGKTKTLSNPQCWSVSGKRVCQKVSAGGYLRY